MRRRLPTGVAGGGVLARAEHHSARAYPPEPHCAIILTRSDEMRASGDWKPLRAVGSTAYTDALPLATCLLALVLPVGLAWRTIGVPWSNESAALLLAAFLLTLLIGAVSANESRGLLWAGPRLYTNALEVRAGDEFRVRWEFASANARIVWILHVRLETRRWPRVERAYEIKVLPGHTEAATA